MPFPGELAERLGEATTASLQPTDGPDRWAAVLEAAAFSPVRTHVTPTARPEQVTDELLATVKRLAPLLPQVAALFGIEVAAGRAVAQAAAPDARRRDGEEAAPAAPAAAEARARPAAGGETGPAAEPSPRRRRPAPAATPRRRRRAEPQPSPTRRRPPSPRQPTAEPRRDAEPPAEPGRSP